MKRKGLIRIGVIADTHGLFDPAILRHFEGVDHIIHAGDIGARFVIEQLEAIAPVTAVSGNVDQFEKSGFPRQAVIRRGGVAIAVRHVLYEKGKLTDDARVWLDRVRPDVCVFGHSHQPTIGRYGPTVLFNPGSAGPRRFSLPRGIGLLTICQDGAEPRLVRLPNRVKGTTLCPTRGGSPVERQQAESRGPFVVDNRKRHYYIPAIIEGSIRVDSLDGQCGCISKSNRRV